jgi:hypothetical protein
MLKFMGHAWDCVCSKADNIKGYTLKKKLKKVFFRFDFYKLIYIFLKSLSQGLSNETSMNS